MEEEPNTPLRHQDQISDTGRRTGGNNIQDNQRDSSLVSMHCLTQHTLEDSYEFMNYVVPMKHNFVEVNSKAIFIRKFFFVEKVESP